LVVGGNEPPLVNGHLSGGEPIVKPTQKVGLNFYKGGSIYEGMCKIVKLDNQRQ